MIGKTMDVFKWLMNTRFPWMAHAAIVLVLLLAAGFLFAQSTSFSDSRTMDALSEIMPSERRVACLGSPDKKALANPDAPSQATPLVKALLPNLGNYPASEPEKQRITDQALKAQRLECLHASFVGLYARNYYGSVVVSVIFGGVSAIALFLMGTKGWSNANPYVANLFLTSAAITAFYAAFPNLFQQSAMLSAHKAQLLRYEALLDGMASHTAAPNLVPFACLALNAARVRDKPYPPADFIACTDLALASADVPFGLDPASRPDYSKAFGVSPK